MATKQDMPDWVAASLRKLGGSGTIVQVAKVIWEQHEDELRASGDLFYTWKYDMRWAGHQLRKQQVMYPAGESHAPDASRVGVWELQ